MRNHSRFPPLLYLHGLLILAALSGSGCHDQERPRLISAEFVDETPDGLPLQNETILLTFDRPLPQGTFLRAKVEATPPVAWTPVVLEPREDPPHVLRVRIQTGQPLFHFRGIHGVDPKASAIKIDLGDGATQWADLQMASALPVLVRAVWEDRSPPGGNLVVDQGDWIRLSFNRPVTLNLEAPEGDRVRSPQDVLLTKAGDRLDDGSSQDNYARFEQGDNEYEIRIVLGSRPVLSVAGSLPEQPEAVDRFSTTTPSGLALNGTQVLPMAKIIEQRGGPGAISPNEIDLQFRSDFPLPPHSQGADSTGERFPEPGARMFHTVTPIPEARALVVGGATTTASRPIDQVFVYDPVYKEEGADQAFSLQQESLPHPTYHHTATALAGPDGESGTADDVIVIAGGTDGSASLSDLTVLTGLARGAEGGVKIALKGNLRVHRQQHAAVAVSKNQILIDGGLQAGKGLVECAERITLSFKNGEVHLEEHAVFRTLARMLHTLTLIPTTAKEEGVVLAYGGFGRRRIPKSTALPYGTFGSPLEPTVTDFFFPMDRAVVLVSPILIHVQSPTESIDLPYEDDFSDAFLRWGHAAVLLGSTLRPDGTRDVLVAGGTLQPFQPSKSPWEIPRNEILFRHQSGKLQPQGHAAIHPLVIHINTRAPSESHLEVLQHPSPDPIQVPERVHFSPAVVPQLGILIAGGEPHEGQPLSSAEIFLTGKRRLAELAIRLAWPRARHQSYVVDHRNGKKSLYLIGGIGILAKDGSPLPAVEELLLK